MRPEAERGDDAEVAAAAPQRPEQLRVLLGARARLRAVGEDDVGLDQVVDREPVLAREVADAAPQGEAADAGGADDPRGRGQTVLVRRGVDLRPGAAAADAHGARGSAIDLDSLHEGEVEHDAVVADPQSAAVVSAAANGEQQVVAARERDRLAPRPSVFAQRAISAGRRSIIAL